MQNFAERKDNPSQFKRAKAQTQPLSASQPQREEPRSGKLPTQAQAHPHFKDQEETPNPFPYPERLSATVKIAPNILAPEARTGGDLQLRMAELAKINRILQKELSQAVDALTEAKLLEEKSARLSAEFKLLKKEHKECGKFVRETREEGEREKTETTEQIFSLREQITNFERQNAKLLTDLRQTENFYTGEVERLKQEAKEREQKWVGKGEAWEEEIFSLREKIAALQTFSGSCFKRQAEKN